MSLQPEKEFDGRRILITGASGSIGSATAKKLAEAGAHLVLNGRDVVKLERLAADLTAESCVLAPFDLNDGDGIPGWMRDLAEKDGPFAGVAHMAGIYTVRPMRALNAEYVDNMLHTNVTSGIMLGKALRQKACHTDGASLVLASSTSSLTQGGGIVSYAASKGAVTASTKAMAHELLRDKIRVNCVVPALVESEMVTYARKIIPQENWDAMVAQQSMGLGDPADVAHAVIYLLSDRTRWMTGTALQIDGGLSIGF